MSPIIATILISILAIFSGALIAAAGALWRLGNKVGGFETALAAAGKAAEAAKAAASEAQAAAQRASADAIAAVRAFWDQMQATVREFEAKVQDAQQRVMDHSARVLDRMSELDKRLGLIEHDHEHNHPPEVSQRHLVEDGAPTEGLFDVRSERKPR